MIARTHNPLKLLSLSLALSLGMAVSTGFSTGVVAQQPSQQSSGTQGVTGSWNAFNPPNRGLPGGRQEGGGVRGPCPNGSEKMTALSPQTDAGLTASGSPSFLLFVPEGLSLPMEFTLSEYADGNNQAEKEVYKTRLTLTGTPGIISVSLPGNKSLDVGKNYYWSFALVCKENAPEASIIRGGWVQRAEVSPSLQQEIAKASTEKQADIYAREGMWYDTVATLAQLRRNKPEDTTIQARWQALLNGVDLDNLANASFTDYK